MVQSCTIMPWFHGSTSMSSPTCSGLERFTWLLDRNPSTLPVCGCLTSTSAPSSWRSESVVVDGRRLFLLPLLSIWYLIEKWHLLPSISWTLISYGLNINQVFDLQPYLFLLGHGCLFLQLFCRKRSQKFWHESFLKLLLFWGGGVYIL